MIAVSFVNMKGGVGKTTLAVNVADALVRRLEKRVLLVDVDPQFNATQSLIGGDEYLQLRQAGASTIYDIFSERNAPIISPVRGAADHLPRKLEEIEPTILENGLHIIPGNLEIYRIEMVAGHGTEMRLKSFLKKKEMDYDYAIIDTPPTPSVFMSSALLASSHYIVPIKPEPMSRVGIDLLQGIINRISENNAHELTCAGIVITMAQTNTIVFKNCKAELEADTRWKNRLLRAHIPNRTEIARIQGEQGLILDANDIDAKRAITNVVSELVERLNG